MTKTQLLKNLYGRFLEVERHRLEREKQDAFPSEDDAEAHRKTILMMKNWELDLELCIKDVLEFTSS